MCAIGCWSSISTMFTKTTFRVQKHDKNSEVHKQQLSFVWKRKDSRPISCKNIHFKALSVFSQMRYCTANSKQVLVSVVALWNKAVLKSNGSIMGSITFWWTAHCLPVDNYCTSGKKQNNWIMGQEMKLKCQFSSMCPATLLWQINAKGQHFKES